MLAEASNKGFFGSDGFQKILEKAPEMFEKFVAMKSGNVSETPARLSQAPP